MYAIDHEHMVRLHGVVLHNEALMLVSIAKASTQFFYMVPFLKLAIVTNYLFLLVFDLR